MLILNIVKLLFLKYVLKMKKMVLIVTLVLIALVLGYFQFQKKFKAQLHSNQKLSAEFRNTDPLKPQLFKNSNSI